MTRGKALGWAALGALLLAWLLTGLTEVRPGERAVVRRFGRVIEVRTQPGLRVGLPWGIDRVEKVSVKQVRRVTVGYRPDTDGVREDTPPGQLLTGDHNLVNVRVTVNYTADPEAVIDYVVQRDRVEELIERTAEAVLAEWVAGRKVDEVLLNGKRTLPRDLVERTQERLGAYRLGVILLGADVELAPPDDVKHAFDEVAKAEADRKTAVEQAHQEAKRRENEAVAEIRKLEEETRAYLASRPEQARADAAAFEARLREYRSNPLVREAGRWDYLIRTVKRLGQNGQLFPLDPDIDASLPGRK